jgi:hypothetical protein
MPSAEPSADVRFAVPLALILGGVVPVIVFTHEHHRKRGLASILVRSTVAAFDGAGGSVLLLGTGSPHAAATYAKNGFVPLAGASATAAAAGLALRTPLPLDTGSVGYNPDDLGELMMVRTVDGRTFVPSSHYDGEGLDAAASFSVEQLRRAHWAELVLLMVSFEGSAKLPVAGIDSGLESEERLCALMNGKLRGSTGEPTSSLRRVLVARHRTTGVVHGIGLRATERAAQGDETNLYAPPASHGARTALAEALDAAR